MTPDDLFRQCGQTLEILSKTKRISLLEYGALSAALEVAYGGGDADEHLQALIDIAEGKEPQGMCEPNIQRLKRMGMTYEYPGFLNYRSGQYDMTIGHDQREGGKGFCVQIVDSDGQGVACRDCDTVAQVLALLSAFHDHPINLIAQLKRQERNAT